jgi:hypothetical protein
VLVQIHRPVLLYQVLFLDNSVFLSRCRVHGGWAVIQGLIHILPWHLTTSLYRTDFST